MSSRTPRVTRRFLALLSLLLLCACAEKPGPIRGCVASGAMVPVCGFSNPEDMELLPDGATLLISEMGAPDGSKAGTLALYDTTTGVITRLEQFTRAEAELWGESSCTEPPGAAFSPHGIDLSQRQDHRWQLLAVNHGGRESVEYFELYDDDAGYRLGWRGCVHGPGEAYFNDVAALPDGGFLATHMFDRGSPRIGSFDLALLPALLGFDTGHAMHWDGRAFSVQPGSEGPFPNGIRLGPDGNSVYLNLYFGDEVRKLRYPDGALLGKARIRHPDNSAWSADGLLLIASHVGGLASMLPCYDPGQGPCPLAYDIVALDPETMHTTTIVHHAGAPMGAATIAQQVGDRLYLGSFSADRIVRLPMPPAASGER